ncbi:MAG: hypothetical protein HOK81_07575 [Rhodospirillaceae bacterium]|jgi:hypothetical protein|nr:hypothetical protein [Rhodospirillaceae bacterium]
MKRSILPLAAALTASLAFGGAFAAEDQPQVIDLTQVGCQFLESENGVDRGFDPKSAEDCEAINVSTGEARLAEAKVLNLKPGRYIFRVTNENVPYELGFWLREHDYDWANPIHKLTKTSISGGGLTTGTTKDYEVELAEGEFLYSCPLNPTPDYRLVVAQ